MVSNTTLFYIIILPYGIKIFPFLLPRCPLSCSTTLLKYDNYLFQTKELKRLDIEQRWKAMLVKLN